MKGDETKLQQERGVNQQYMFLLQRRIDEDASIARLITSLPRNSQFHGDTATKWRGPVIEPFYGRVVLSESDPDLGSGFYIGSYRLDSGDLQVISFAAPMAELFYRGRKASVDISNLLAGRRTFDRSFNDLVDFEDELEHGVHPDPFDKPVTAADAFATAPAPVARPVMTPRPAELSTPKVAETTSAAQIVVPPADTRVPEVSSLVAARIEDLRAPKIVLSAVTAPRTGRLKSLLATLQPQQYELVTWPEEDHLVVQGHPGTGKTVIGVHRAAFLTDPERLPKGRKVPVGDVLVLGPTAAYVDHVKPLLADIARPGWEVWSLPHFYAELGGLKELNQPTNPSHVATSADPLGVTVDRALVAYTGRRNVRDFAQYLFASSMAMAEAAGHDREVLDFLSGGRSYEYAKSQSEFHPLLALAGLAVTGVSLADRFRHVIVDEAQDLRHIDLKMLRLLVSHGVTLTLLGDMNQRRSDFTHDSWRAIAADLNINSDDGTPPLVAIDTGFRSTNQILRYAEGLLHKSERGATALRDGLRPETIPCRGQLVTASALEQAQLLSDRLGGLTAIITLDPKVIRDYFRLKGWLRVDAHIWTRTSDSPHVFVIHPDDARGLEFDGVVVIEPADFPAILGRHGVLYTSLTRATKELVVVHSKALPRELRAR